eukprot:TRINITY_DN7069_c0_g1_i6.p1 TRINITY_DN7069_c0_g1~~TRINITY_DN7069_c0_g1_i6.p1  ORF type:complete len:587 (-),score=63.38 TRINITY_DN7069_c0_g1_i6:675-2435(-)
MRPRTLLLFCFVFSSMGYTIDTLSLPFSRSQMKSVASSNKDIYFFGGMENSYPSSRVDVYNPTTKQIDNTLFLSSPVSKASVVVVKDMIFCVGGNSSFYELRIFNTTSKQNRTETLSASTLDYVGVNVLDIVLFAGGQSGGILLNISSGTLTPISLSNRRTKLAATASGKYAFFAGGSYQSQSSSTVDVYNRELQSWSTNYLSQGRENLAATAVMDLVLFAGGYSSVSLRESDVVDLFNSTARNWYNARLSAPRQYLAGISTSEIALFAGGLGGGFSDVVDIYNVTSNTWISATLGVGRGMIYPTGVSIGDRIFVGDGGFLNVFDFSPATTASSSLVSSLSSTVSSQTMYSESISTTATSSSFSVISTVTSMERSTTATSDDGRTSTSFTSSQSIETSDIRSSNIISNDLSSSETTSSNVDTSSLSTFTSSSENDTMEDRNSSQLSKEVLATVIVIPIVLAIVSTALVFFIIRKKRDVGADVPLEEASGLDANRHLVDTKPELTSVTVLHKLGEGSFGQVYYGRWQGTPVALKKLNQEEYKAFRKEAAILSTINHPNVIQFLGLYTSNDGFQYMVTEYAANGRIWC